MPDDKRQIHEDDLLAYISGGTELDDETYWTIANERKQDGSPIHQWFKEFDTKCRDPFNIDWWQVAFAEDYFSDRDHTSVASPEAKPRKRPGILRRLVGSIAVVPLEVWREQCTKNGQYARAIWSQKLLCVAREDTRGHAQTLYNLGVLYWTIGDIENALKSMNGALTVADETPAEYSPIITQKLQILRSLVRLHMQKADFRAAERCLERVNLLRSGALESTELAVDVNARAIVAYYRGDHDEALRLFRQAVAESVEVFGEANPIQGIILANLSAVYTAFGNKTDALAARQNSLRILKPHLDNAARVLDETSTVVSIPFRVNKEQHLVELLPTVQAA